MAVKQGKKYREMQDGGGRCSPGRWKLGARAHPDEVAKEMVDWFSHFIVEHLSREERSKAVCMMATGKVSESPWDRWKSRLGVTLNPRPRPKKGRGVYRLRRRVI